jgi:hypothetical protein
MLSDREHVEVFHLAFTRLLVAGADKRPHIAVKGGCNLRFFFGSPRFSEDIDFDVAVISKDTLKKNVDKLLGSDQLATQLRIHGLKISGASAPKQTDTTQRWKVALTTSTGVALHSKIEFSRRATSSEAVVEPIDPTLCARYGVQRYLAAHYGVDEAIRQKIGALAGRVETQARDVFDLAHLFARAAGSVPAWSGQPALLPSAQERALSLSYDDHAAQVLSYLAPDERALFESPEDWAQLQLTVVDALERMKR